MAVNKVVLKSGKVLMDTSGVTVVPGVLYKGKTALNAAGELIVGTFAPDEINEVEQAVPVIEVSSGGLIAATSTQEGGYVSAGTKRTEKQLEVQAEKEIMPGAADQTAVKAGRFTTGDVTVRGDENLKAENIAAGVSIFGVTGTLEPEVAPEIEQVEQAVPVIEVSSGGLVTAYARQEAGLVEKGTKSSTKQLTVQAAKTVTPSTAEQTAVSAGVYTTGAVKVEAMATATQATPSISVDSAGKITASATQSAGYVSAGTKSATKQLTVQEAKTVTPTTSNQIAVASGRYTTGAVTVKGDENLKAENIAKGVSIFGVTGTHEGGSSIGNVQVTLSVSEGVNNTISNVYWSEALDNGTIKTSSRTGILAGNVLLEIASGSCFVVDFTSNYLNALQTDGIEYLAVLNGYNMESFSLVCHVTAAAGENASLTI